MKFLAVVTPPSIYHGCFTRKTFWEENFIGEEDLFLSVNMKNRSGRRIREHKEIKGSDKYITLDISSKFDSLDKMKTTSSESKGKLEKSGKGLVTSLGFKTKVRSQRYKKASYAIRDFSEKDFSKIIKEFEKIGKLPYEKKRPKHGPNDSYFHLVRKISKCMMRSDKLNRHNRGGYKKMNALSLNFYSLDEDKSKRIIVQEGLSQSSSTNKGESKRSIVNEKLSQSCSMNESK